MLLVDSNTYLHDGNVYNNILKGHILAIQHQFAAVPGLKLEEVYPLGRRIGDIFVITP